jgi:hypothetical protein
MKLRKKPNVSVFGSVIAVTLQSVFYLEMYHIFLFFKNYF